jgi:hypothetical protein
MPLLLTFIIVTFIHTFIHPSPFAEARLLISSSRGCRAENRTRACLTQQADALPTGLRRTY